MASRYALSVLITAAAALATFAIESAVGPSPFPVFYLAVLLTAFLAGTGPGLAALALSVAVIDVAFLPPRGQIVHSPHAMLRLGLFILVAACILLITREMRRTGARLKRALAEREKVMAQLEEKQALLEVTLSQLPTGVVIARAPSGDIVLANQQVRKILRTSPRPEGELAEAARLDIRGTDGASLRPDEWPIYRALRRGEVVVDEEVDVTRGDGTHAVLVVSASPLRDAGGAVIASVASFYDVTERRRAEEDIKRSERLLRAVLDALPVGVWITDEQGMIRMGNPAGQEVWGGARYVGPQDYGQYKGWWPDTGRRIEAEEWSLARAVRRGERSLGEVVEIEAFDGTRKFVLNSAVPILEGERIAGAIVVNQDITRLKEAEREVRRLNADLERRVDDRTQALKAVVRELEEFAYTVAHDLRAPLRAMSGLSTLLTEEYRDKPLDAQGREYARRIVEASGRMDTLIQDLLAYSRAGREEYDIGAVPLDPILSELTADMAAEFRQHRAVVDVDPSGTAVRAHPLLLRQAVRNLLSNAVKFVAPGTTPRVRIWIERRDGRVRLWIEDNGIGIAPEHRHRIFGVFQRLHPQEAYPGTGMGLPIVRRAVERMGGSAGVESEPGRGSRFWIELNAG